MTFAARIAAPVLAGLALATLPASGTAQDTASQEQVAVNLVPFYQSVSKHDILGLTIGMSLDDAIDQLQAAGFDIDWDRRGRSERGRGSMRYFKATRERGDNRPTYEAVTVYFDISHEPRLMAVYRNSRYNRQTNPSYASTMQALLDRFGDADVWDRRFNEKITGWQHGKLKRKCRIPQTNFRHWSAPQDMGFYEGCFSGLAIEVGFDPNKPLRPVQYTKSYLVDHDLMVANRRESLRLGKEKALAEERERQQGVRSNRPAEF